MEIETDERLEWSKMAHQICFHCFKEKGNFSVCRYCGWNESTEPKQAFHLAPGTLLNGKYIIGRSIGSGGFAITYKAYDMVLNQLVAIKELYPSGYVKREQGETAVSVFEEGREAEYNQQKKQFVEEAKKMRDLLNEEDIVKVYDCVEENETAYIIMTYVKEKLLRDRLKEGRMTEENACRYMLAILKALGKVHRYGIIHQDISPDNIFAAEDASIKLFDFGAARFQGEKSLEDPLGKPGYAPPEQYDRQNSPCACMDIYAAGAVFYEMITGERPIDAQDRIKGKLLKNPDECGVFVSVQTKKAVFRALELKPEDRFQTAEEFEKAISQILEQKSEKHFRSEEEFEETMPETIALRMEEPVHPVEGFGGRIWQLGKRKKAAAGAVAILTAGVTIAGLMVSMDRDRMKFEDIESEQLSIWLCAEEETGEKLAEMLLESVQKACGQLSVDVKIVSSESYVEQLTEAAVQNELPDVFCTDGIPASEYCMELSDLIDSMELSSYLYMEQLADQEEVYALPTALQVGTVYMNREKEEDIPKYFDYAGLREQKEQLGYADETGIFEKFGDAHNQVSLIAGDLSDMTYVEEVTIKKIPSTDFAALPILKEGKLTGSLKNYYGIKKCEDKNKRYAEMALLSILLSDGIQSVYYMDNEEGLPLNKIILEDYKVIKLTTYLSFVKDYDLEEVLLYENTNLCNQIRKEIGGNR